MKTLLTTLAVLVLSTAVEGVNSKHQRELKTLAIGVPLGKSLNINSRGGYDFLSLVVSVQEDTNSPPTFLCFRTIAPIVVPKVGGPPSPPPWLYRIQRVEAVLDQLIRQETSAKFIGVVEEITSAKEVFKEPILWQIDWGDKYSVRLN